MRNVLKRLTILVIVLAMCIPALAVVGFAAEQPEVKIPVTITLEGTLPSPAEQFTVVLTPDDEAYPMPEGTVDGAYSLKITGAAKKEFPAIVFTRVGVYTYQVKQLAGTNKDCTYDTAVYSVKVFVTNAEEGGLEANMVVYSSSESDKTEILFHNKYKVVPPPTDPTLPQTGQINWPIPVLIAAGVLLIGSGVVVISNYRKDEYEN